MANIGFISLGCAKNQVDCERMMYRVQEAGHTVCAGIEGCDVVVINTCGFIDSAKSEAIDYILMTAGLKAQGSVGKILVTGCLSQRYQEEILQELPEVDGVLGTGSYTQVVAAIDALLQDQTVVDFGDINAPEEETGRILTTPEHYAFLKIAEGCDNRCGYVGNKQLEPPHQSKRIVHTETGSGCNNVNKEYDDKTNSAVFFYLFHMQSSPICSDFLISRFNISSAS